MYDDTCTQSRRKMFGSIKDASEKDIKPNDDVGGMESNLRIMFALSIRAQRDATNGKLIKPNVVCRCNLKLTREI